MTVAGQKLESVAFIGRGKMESDSLDGQASTEVKGLSIQAEQVDGVLIARLDGRIDGQNAQDFKKALEGLLADRDVNLLLDLGQVTFLSSAGLGVLLSIARQLHKKAGKIAVCSLSDSIRGVFLISGFHKIIPTHDNQRDAMVAIS